LERAPSQSCPALPDAYLHDHRHRLDQRRHPLHHRLPQPRRDRLGLAGVATSRFGLASAVQADAMDLDWPSGIVQKLANAKAGPMLAATEAAR
jgi:hypothetical protein